MKNSNFEINRSIMVKEQIERRGIKDKNIIEAFLNVPRHLFVDPVDQHLSYEDYPLYIGYNQTISQPYMVALMTYHLKPSKEDTILEIGTGSGYQTAILSLLCKEVYTIEVIKELQQKAIKMHQILNYQNIYYFHKNGFDGLKEHAPYDKIIVTAAPKEVPMTLFNQLKEQGKMIIPLGDHLLQGLFLITKIKGHLKKELICYCRFVSMIDKEI